MFRLAIVVLAIVGLVSLFSSGASGFAAGAGFLFLFPLLLLVKVLFLVMIFGVMGRGFSRRGRSHYQPSWGRWDRSASGRVDKSSNEDAFEEWHRMAHAKEEVDSWLENTD